MDKDAPNPGFLHFDIRYWVFDIHYSRPTVIWATAHLLLVGFG